MKVLRLAGLIAVFGATTVACSSAGNQLSPSPATSTPTPAQSPSAMPTSSPSAAAGSVVVTFKVGDEQYKILLTDPADIGNARVLLAGGQAPRIPNGLIIRGASGVNAGWSWSIDPEDFEFADMTTEVCDGLPSYVEAGTLSGDRFCPWTAQVVAVEPAP